MGQSELAFVVIGGAGLILLVASWLLGGFEFGVDGDADADSGNNGMPSFFSFSTFAAMLVGTGVVGYAALSLGSSLVVAWICAIGGGIVLGYALLYGILRPLAKQEHNATIGRSSYSGLMAEVIMAIPGDSWGEVKFTDANGALVTQCAWSQEGNGIPKGARVLICDVRSDGVTVTPLQFPS